MKVLPYWLSQLVGGFLGTIGNLAIFYRVVAEYEDKLGFRRGSSESIQSASAFTDYYSLSDLVDGVVHVFILEAMGTAFLVFMFFVFSNQRNRVPEVAIPLLVGLAYGVTVTIIGPFTNAGINPARDLGPRMALWLAGWGKASFSDALVYAVAPMVGAPIGALMADNLLFSSQM